MFKVLFKTYCEEDNELVRSQILANHNQNHNQKNNDQIIVSHIIESADIVVNVPKIQKRSALVFDHSGSVHRLGYPDSIEYDSLPKENDGMDSAEKKKQEQEKKERLPEQCENCNFMKMKFICEKCGHRPSIGADVDTDRSRGLNAVSGKERTITKAEKQDFYSQLIGYQRERIAKGRPVSDGWVAHKYKAKFGAWPQSLSKSAKVPSGEVKSWITSQNIRYAKSKKSGYSRPTAESKAVAEQVMGDLKGLFE